MSGHSLGMFLLTLDMISYTYMPLALGKSCGTKTEVNVGGLDTIFGLVDGD